MGIPGSWSAADRRWRMLAWMVVVVALAWGARVTVLEGLVYSWPRAFFGDFYALMFTNVLWDGTGIVYGPIFALERALIRAFPGILTIHSLAVTNVALVAIALVASIAACGTSRLVGAAAVAAWLCTFPLAYALSVAAGPEIVEMTLLSLGWLAATRARRGAEGALVAAAALVKIVPGIFVLPGLVRPGWRRFVAGGVLATLAALTVTGVAQGLGPLEVIRATFLPSISPSAASGHRPESFFTLALQLQTDPQNSGLQAALARLLIGLGADASGGDRSPFNLAIVTVTAMMVFAALAGATLVARRAQRDAPGHRSTVLAYTIFFSLLPLATFLTHPHTTVLLLPAWTGILWLLANDAPPRALRHAVPIAAGYVWVALPVIPTIIDRVFGTSLTPLIVTDPMWGELAVIATLLRYGWTDPQARV